MKLKLLLNCVSQFVILAFGLSSLNLVYAAQSYQVVEIANLGSDPAFVYSINNNNIIVGYSRGPEVNNQPDFQVHAFSYRVSDETVTDLGVIDNSAFQDDESYSIAFAINNNDIAAGFSRKNYDNSGQAAFFEQATYFDSGMLNEIEGFNANQNARALGSNDNGLIVGFARYNPPGEVNAQNNPLYYDRGFIFDLNNPGQPAVRIDPPGSEQALNVSLRDINNSGIALGYRQAVTNNNQNFNKGIYLDAASPTVINEIPALVENGDVFPWKINTAGKIVGKARNDNNQNTLLHEEAFLFDSSSMQMTALGTLYNVVRFSEAFDINDMDQIVGTSRVEGNLGRNHAFLYENDQMKDLNDLINCKVDINEEPIGDPDWILYEARAINDQGYIVGNGLLNGVNKAFLLIPDDNQPPILCQPEVAEEDSDSGSFPLSLMIVLLISLLIVRSRWQLAGSR